MTSPKISSVEELKIIRESYRRGGKTVVQCHGCFDIVRGGHVIEQGITLEDHAQSSPMGWKIHTLG